MFSLSSAREQKQQSFCEVYSLSSARESTTMPFLPRAREREGEQCTAHGEVVDVFIPYEREAGDFRRIAKVEFLCPESVEKVRRV